MTWLVLLLLASLANWQAVETYHHGEIFANMRARFDARVGFTSDLVGCPFCLSHWTAMIFAVWVVFIQLPTSGSELWGIMPMFWLSTVRLSNLFNDLTHSVCRTPRQEQQFAQDLGEMNASINAAVNNAIAVGYQHPGIADKP
jgi:hypothetical protein